MSAPTPGTPRALALMCRLAVRRWRNQIAARSRKQPPAPAPVPGARLRAQARVATPGKRFGLGVPFLLLLGMSWLFSGLLMVSRCVSELAIASDGRIVVSSETYRRLQLHQLLEPGSGSGIGPAAPPSAGGGGAQVYAQPDLERVIAHDARRQALSDELAARGVPAPQREQLLAQWEERYAVRGLDAFTLAHDEFMPGIELWPQKQGEGVFIARLAVLVAACSCVLLSFALGSGSRDLGALEWSMEWLYTLPVSARALFLARVLEHALISPLAWMLVFPFFLVVLGCAGWGWWSLPAAAVGTVHLALVCAALRVVLETALRLYLPAAARKNLQAIITLGGLVLFYLVLWVVQKVPPWFLDATAGLGPLTAWCPGAQPLLLLCAPWYVAAPVLLLAPLLAAWGAALLCERLVARGLDAVPGAFQGARLRAGAGLDAWPRRLFSGILAKDLALLGRDRTFMVQTLVAPVLVVGFQLLLNPQLLGSIANDPRHAAMFAFLLGAYLLLASAFGVLAVEGPALWLLYALPHRLHRLLVAKAMLWAGFALAYAAAVLVVCAACAGRPALSYLPDGALALVGVALYAFIAAAFGVFMYRPQSLERAQAPPRDPGLTYLYLMLAGCFAWAIWNDSWWGRIAQLVLTLLLVYALWQKVADRLPYLLDPVSSPPPALSVSDGLIAVLAFFVIQGLIALPLALVEWPLAQRQFIAYACSAVVVALCCQYSFMRAKVPDLLRAVGLRAGAGARSAAGGLAIGVAAGACASGAGLLYLLYIRDTALYQQARAGQSLLEDDGGMSVWLLALLVVAAPMAEEYLFRGLLFRGLRRSWGLAPSVLASAGVFAIVHPPLSAVPVFVLGAAAAIAFEYSGLLLAPIIVHALYNAFMVLFNRLL